MRYDRIIRWTAASQLRRIRRALCDFFSALRGMAAAILECTIALLVLPLTPILGPLTFGLAHRRNWNIRGRLIRRARNAANDGPIGRHPLGRDRKFWLWAFPNSRLYQMIDRAYDHSHAMARLRFRRARREQPAGRPSAPEVVQGVVRAESKTDGE